jgi:hypothetical protein
MPSEQFGQTPSHHVGLPAGETQTSQVSPQQFRTDAERAAYRAETDRLASELTELAGQLNAGNYFWCCSRSSINATAGRTGRRTPVHTGSTGSSASDSVPRERRCGYHCGGARALAVADG